jgi:hypothetical protein
MVAGLFNRRALLAFTLCFAGVFLAMLGFATTPPGGITGSRTDSLASTPSGSWRIVSSPNTSSSEHNFLARVACTGPNNCWTVGHSTGCINVPGGSVCNIHRTLIERWDGTSWSIVTSPSPNTAANVLYDVTCVSANDCWAAGYQGGPAFGAPAPETLIVHWDGTSWSVVVSPTPLPDGTLNGVACASANDCWAVGYGSNIITNRTDPLIEHWDGTLWSIAPSPNPDANQFHYPQRVACASTSDCWAAGYSYDGSVYNTLFLHWDGTSWSVAPGPTISSSNRVLGVTCASGSDCWTAGFSQEGFYDLTLTERWNGTSWSVVASPNVTANGANILLDVTCASASDCWAVGFSQEAINQTLVQHWDGIVWRVFPSPNTSPLSLENALLGVTCASASDCWAVGDYYPDIGTDGPAQTLIQHYTASPLIPTSMVSRKAHGSAGDFDIDLPLAGNPGIECRSGGPNGNYTMVFTFANVLSAVTGVTATATTSGGTAPVTVLDTSGIGTDTHQYILNLSEVPNASHFNVTLNGVTDSASNAGDVSAHMDVLLGDVNSTGRTDSGDVTVVRNHTVSVPDQQTFQFDINTSGRIDSGDLTVTRNASVTILP